MIENAQNTIASYLNLVSQSVTIQITVVMVLAWVFAVLVNRLFLTWMARLVEKVDRDNPLVTTKYGPLYFSLILLGLAIAVQLLTLSTNVYSVINSILMTALIVVWTRFALKFIRFFLRGLAKDKSQLQVLNGKTLPLYENVAYIFINLIALYYIFSNWNIDMTAWLASAGIIGIAVGFAAKDTLANLFSGFFIMIDAPYKIGDYVVLESGDRGEITKIGIRSTRMLTRDDVEITVPNSLMGNSKIFNESGGRQQATRIRVKVGVAYGSDVDKVRQILMDIGVNDPATISDPEPRVRFRFFGASSLDFELCCWIEEPALRGRIMDGLNTAVYKAFIENGIEIPYAKQDIYIKELPTALSNTILVTKESE